MVLVLDIAIFIHIFPFSVPHRHYLIIFVFFPVLENMDAYSLVKSGKLKLKGHAEQPKKRKHKSSKDTASRTAKVAKNTFNEDLEAHGGWWEISKFADIIGPVAIQMTGLTPAPETSGSAAQKPLPLPPAYYLSASEDGFINLGPPRREGEPPAPEEIFSAVKVSDTKVAFKTG